MNRLHWYCSEDPCTVKMQDVEMWVQAYDIPKGFISENILKSVGASVGKFVRVDSNTFDGIWKPFVRIRVAINIDKPLKRRMKIRRKGAIGVGLTSNMNVWECFVLFVVFWAILKEIVVLCTGIQTR